MSKSDPVSQDTSALGLVDLLQHTSLMGVLLDADQRIIEVSDAALHALGRPLTAVLGCRLQDLGVTQRNALQAVLAPAQDHLFIQSKIADLHGATLVLLHSSSEEARGKGISADLGTDTAERLSTWLDTTDAGAWEWDLDTGAAYYGPRWLDMLGYEPDDLAPYRLSTAEDLTHPDDLETVRAALSTHLAGQTYSFRVQIRMQHKAGYWVWVACNGRRLDTTPARICGTIQCLEQLRAVQRHADGAELLMNRIGRAAGVGGWKIDLETGELIWTEETRRIHGVGPDYAPTLEEALEFYDPEARDVISKTIDTAIAEGTSWDMELPFTRRGGERIWVRAVGEVEYRGGVAVSLFGAFQDITERVKRDQDLAIARQQAQEARARLWSAIESLPEAFVLYDAEDRAVMFNAKYRNLYAESAAAIERGETFEQILRAGLDNKQYPEAIGREEAWLEERLERHRNPTGPIEQVLPGDRHLQIHEVRLDNGDTVGFRVDVTQLKRQQRELADKARALEVAATTDPLTALINRRGLEEIMRQKASTGAATEVVGLLHVDLDRFKPINDVFGHAAGDHLLGHVSEILSRNVRGRDFVARVGGDEFVVILSAPVDEERAATISDRIIEHCSRPVPWQDKTLHFGASIGIALGAPKDLPVMLHNADIALYEAKKGGRNQHHFFNADLRDWVETRKTLSDDLLVGLQRGEVIAHYQPQFSAQDGRLVGVEALARWDHPSRGTLPPSMFLEIAEEMGVLAEVDRLVFEHALETGRRLEAANCGLEKVAVNVSLPRLTQSPDLGWLPHARDLPFQLCLEILEAVDVDRDFDEIAWVFDGLRERGINVEVDDFGSGRASLTSLLKIRPDRIKLDTQIVRAAALDPAGAGSMVRAIAEMCRGLNIPMTAEGIETADHAELMRDMGCDILQGYHFARPMARSELQALALRPTHRLTGRASGE